MGKNQSKIVQESIFNSTVNNIINTLQQATSEVRSSQELNVDCNEVYKLTQSNYSECLKSHPSLNADDLLKICSPILNSISCNVNGISMKNSIKVTDISEQLSKLEQFTSEKSTTKMQSDIKQNSGLSNLTFSNQSKQKLTNIVNKIVNVINSKRQEIFNTNSSSQVINIRSGTVKFVTMDSVLDITRSYIQSNDDIQTSISELSTELIASVDQGSSSIFSTIFTVILIIIMLLVLFGVILWFLKKMRKDKTK